MMQKVGQTSEEINQTSEPGKVIVFPCKPVYMFGHLVPRNHDQAMELDNNNGNNHWKQAEILELVQIHEYRTFLDKEKNASIPDGYQQIKVHFAYAVKYDGRYKARLVVGGHLTNTPVDSVYSSGVSLRCLRLVVFLGELNDFKVCATNNGNTYLEFKTKEKVCIVAGPGFRDLEGHTLVILKAFYGHRSSGVRWHGRFADTLHDKGFFPSKAEDDIWMRSNGDSNEYITIYVNDLCIVAKEPNEIIRVLQEEYKYNLKGTGPISYHLDCDFFGDTTGTLCLSPKTYVKKMELTYQKISGTAPKPATSPLEKNDHLEFDTSDELNVEGIQKYQSLIGALQWAVSIGMMDITASVMTMSDFRVASRKGRLDRVRRIYGYLSKFTYVKKNLTTPTSLRPYMIGHILLMRR